MHVNTKIEASQDLIFLPAHRIGGVGLCGLWQNLYVMSSSIAIRGKDVEGIEGWNSFENSFVRFFQ